MLTLNPSGAFRPSARWAAVCVLGASLLTLFILAPRALHAQDNTGTSAFSHHEGLFLIGGYGEPIKVATLSWPQPNDPQVSGSLNARPLFLLQFSTKFQLFNEVKSGLFLAYTQKSFWNLMGDSSPFTETNYKPEVFWRLQSQDNAWNDLNLGVLEHLQLGVMHESTGVAGAQSRGYDQAYAQLALRSGEGEHFSLTTRYSWYLYEFMPSWYAGETRDRHLYRSNLFVKAGWHSGQETVFFLPKRITFEASPGGGLHALDWSKGYVQATVLMGSLFGGLSPYAQGFLGYGEGLVTYDQRVMSFRVGIYAE